MSYRKYNGLNDNTTFSVFLIQGKGDDYKKVKAFVETKFKFEARAIIDEFGITNNYVISKLLHLIRQQCVPNKKCSFIQQFELKYPI